MANIIPNPELIAQQRREFLRIFSQKGERLEFESETYIEFEHRMLDCVYMIVEGSVQQCFLDANGNMKTLLLLSSGDLFGEVTMLQQDFDLVVTQSTTKTRVVRISREDFFETLAGHPQLNYHVMLILTGKIRSLMAQIYDTSFCDTRGTLISLLHRLALQYGEETSRGTKITIRLTHEEIAQMVGSSRTTVTKKLAQLQREGAISIQGRYIYVLQQAKTNT